MLMDAMNAHQPRQTNCKRTRITTPSPSEIICLHETRNQKTPKPKTRQTENQTNRKHFSVIQTYGIMGVILLDAIRTHHNKQTYWTLTRNAMPPPHHTSQKPEPTRTQLPEHQHTKTLKPKTSQTATQKTLISNPNLFLEVTLMDAKSTHDNRRLHHTRNQENTETEN